MEHPETLLFSTPTELGALARNAKEDIDLKKHISNLEIQKKYTKRSHEVNIQVMSNRFNRAKEKLRRCKTAYSLDKNTQWEVAKRRCSSMSAIEGGYTTRSVANSSMLRKSNKCVSPRAPIACPCSECDTIIAKEPSFRNQRNVRGDMTSFLSRPKSHAGKEFRNLGHLEELNMRRLSLNNYKTTALKVASEHYKAKSNRKIDSDASLKNHLPLENCVENEASKHKTTSVSRPKSNTGRKLQSVVDTREINTRRLSLNGNNMPTAKAVNRQQEAKSYKQIDAGEKISGSLLKKQASIKEVCDENEEMEQLSVILNREKKRLEKSFSQNDKYPSRKISISDTKKLMKRQSELQTAIKIRNLSKSLNQSMPSSAVNRLAFSEAVDGSRSEEVFDNDSNGSLDTITSKGEDLQNGVTLKQLIDQPRKRANTIYYPNATVNPPRKHFLSRSKSLSTFKKPTVMNSVDLLPNTSNKIAEYISKTSLPIIKTEGLLDLQQEDSHNGRDKSDVLSSQCSELGKTENVNIIEENDWKAVTDDNDINNNSIIEKEIDNVTDSESASVDSSVGHRKPRPKTAVCMTSTMWNKVETYKKEREEFDEARSKDGTDDADSNKHFKMLGIPKRKTLADLFEEVKFCRYLRMPKYLEDEQFEASRLCEYTQLLNRTAILNKRDSGLSFDDNAL